MAATTHVQPSKTKATKDRAERSVDPLETVDWRQGQEPSERFHQLVDEGLLGALTPLEMEEFKAVRAGVRQASFADSSAASSAGQRLRKDRADLREAISQARQTLEAIQRAANRQR